MANRKITELNALTGANATDTDVFAIVDISADETKKMTLGELKEAFDTGSGFVRITGDTMTGDLTVPNVVVSGNVDGRDVSADGTKLDGIEAGATADQTAAEIRSLVESATDSNVFTDADHSKLNGIEAGATADQTAAEIKTAYESNANTNEFSDAEQTKLAGIEAGADVTDTANVTSAGALMDSELTDIAAVKALNQGVATTDDPTFTNTQLAALAATITDTAVDVFVYDTRKDSDGGAWRKRTQGTSWYNETLNTATRGSRKEFPAVAVIVAESNQVTIYDGDDPDLPMWIVFNARGGTHADGITILGWYTSGTPTVTAVSALNGIIAVVGADGGAVQIKFIPDSFRIAYSSNSYVTSANISQRETSSLLNVINEGSSGTGGDIVVDYRVNDVAMTVLPNAPIDAATGLPVPTIAVATDGGVSVIKDDGTVVDLGATVATDVTFDEYSGDVFVVYNSSGAVGVYGFNVPSSDQSGYTPSNFTFNNQSWSGAYQWPTAKFRDNAGVLVRDNYVNMGTNDGLYKSIDTALANTPSTNFQAKITSTYNTGWMNGDIKLATLSDTDDTDVTGSELVTNGTFDTDTSGWTALNSATLSVVSGALRISQTTVDYGRAEQAITVEVGKTYTVSVELKGGTGAARVILGATSEGTQYYIGSVLTAAQTISTTFTATTTTAYLTLTNDTTTDNTYYDFDNISVRLAEEDRSVNGNGLQVFGTVTKSYVDEV